MSQLGLKFLSSCSKESLRQIESGRVDILEGTNEQPCVLNVLPQPST